MTTLIVFSSLIMIGIVITQALDYYTTTRTLNLGGKEVNPVMAILIAKFGDLGLIIPKLVIVALMGIVFITDINLKVFPWLGGITILTYTDVLISNYKAMKRQEKISGL